MFETCQNYYGCPISLGIRVSVELLYLLTLITGLLAQEHQSILSGRA